MHDERHSAGSASPADASPRFDRERRSDRIRREIQDEIEARARSDLRWAIAVSFVVVGFGIVGFLLKLAGLY